ncbi:MAG TPA: YmfQ family protein [Rhizomicrobium sp.]|jgi:uncharacterized protein YmfQ (DUF2313 family)
MTAPVFSAADFVSAMQALLPRGRAWPRDAGEVLTQTLNGFAPTFARSAARANALLSDAFPAGTFELLPQWEESLGLPDPCAGQAPTTDTRRAQVVARFTHDGGQSVAYFIDLAAALGYTITITQFAPSQFGRVFGSPFGGTPWAHAWQVNAAEFEPSQMTFGQAFGGPFAFWSNAVLECELRAAAPAHTTLLFSYS